MQLNNLPAIPAFQNTDAAVMAAITARDQRIAARETEITSYNPPSRLGWIISLAVLALLALVGVGVIGIFYKSEHSNAITARAEAQAKKEMVAALQADAVLSGAKITELNGKVTAAEKAVQDAIKAKEIAEKALAQAGVDARKELDELKAKVTAADTAKTNAEKAKAEAERKLAEAPKTPAIDINAAIAEAVARVKSELTRTPAPAPVVPNVIVNHLPTATVAPASPVVAKHSPDVLRRMLARDARVSSSPVGGLITKLLSGSFVADPHGASILEEASAQAAKVAGDPSRDASTRAYALEDASALKGAAEALRAGSGGRVTSVKAKQPLPPIVAGGQPRKK